MSVLIVESDLGLAALWKHHIEPGGAEVIVAAGQQAAISVLQTRAVEVILMNLELEDGSALAVADFASYRRPAAKVIFLAASGLFADGSVFGLAPNACAYLPRGTPPEDLAAMVEHYGRAA